MALRINKDGYKNNYSGVSLQNLINPLPFMLMWQNSYIKHIYTHTHAYTHIYTYACLLTIHTQNEEN